MSNKKKPIFLAQMIMMVKINYDLKEGQVDRFQIEPVRIKPVLS